MLHRFIPRRNKHFLFVLNLFLVYSNRYNRLGNANQRKLVTSILFSFWRYVYCRNGNFSIHSLCVLLVFRDVLVCVPGYISQISSLRPKFEVLLVSTLCFHPTICLPSCCLMYKRRPIILLSKSELILTWFVAFFFEVHLYYIYIII